MSRDAWDLRQATVDFSNSVAPTKADAHSIRQALANESSLWQPRGLRMARDRLLEHLPEALLPDAREILVVADWGDPLNAAARSLGRQSKIVTFSPGVHLLCAAFGCLVDETVDQFRDFLVPILAGGPKQVLPPDEAFELMRARGQLFADAYVPSPTVARLAVMTRDVVPIGTV